MIGRRLAPLLLVALALLAGCGGEELPSRDQIPVLRANLYALEQGIKARDRTAIDSLLSVDILDAGQSSDSLLNFVYGPAGDRPFARLGNYNIFYNNQLAVINCYIMDSTEQIDRPLKLRYGYKTDLWLLKWFGVGDTAAADGT